MLRLDQYEYTAEGRRDSLQLQISDQEWEGSRLSWSFAIIYHAVGNPLDYSDFAARPTLRVESSVFGCEIGHWHELEGQSYETLTNPDDVRAIYLLDETTSARKIFPCHRFEVRLSRRDGYHFTLELRGSYVSKRKRAFNLFDGDGWTEEAILLADEPDVSLYLVEELPLADVHICVPRNSQDPLRNAQNRATALASLDELVPWPGYLPDFAPRWGQSDAALDDSLGLDFVTPWARQ